MGRVNKIYKPTGRMARNSQPLVINCHANDRNMQNGQSITRGAQEAAETQSSMNHELVASGSVVPKTQMEVRGLNPKPPDINDVSQIMKYFTAIKMKEELASTIGLSSLAYHTV